MLLFLADTGPFAVRVHSNLGHVARSAERLLNLYCASSMPRATSGVLDERCLCLDERVFRAHDIAAVNGIQCFALGAGQNQKHLKARYQLCYEK